METNSLLTVLSYVGAAFVAYNFSIGLALTLRYGTTGLRFIWGQRSRLDRHMKSEVSKTIRETQP